MPAARNLILILPLLALVSFPLWRPPAASFLSPGADPDGQPPASSQPGSGVLTMQAATISQFSRGKKDWQVNAQALVMDNGETDLHLEKVLAIFPDQESAGDSGRSAIRVSGEHARYLADKKVLTLTDQVLITTDSGYEVRAGQARFLEKTRQLKVDSDVRINGNSLALRGRAMTYELTTRALVVEGRVEAKVQ